MKRLILIAWISFAGVGLLSAQSPGDPSEGVRIEWDQANSWWRVKWWGKAGRTYFIQHSQDLVLAWEWLPVVEAGEDAVKQKGITVNGGDRSFWRLRYSDIPTSDPKGDDFDGDGVNNLDEVEHGTDPFSAADLDGSGLPDDYETRYFGALGQDPNADPDSDGIKNKYEVMLGTSPWIAQPGPANFQMVQNADRSCDFTWVDQSGGANGHIIVRTNDDGTEDVLGIAPAGVNFFHWKNEDPK